jgi:predicted acylesterase/phospholipase RssA
LPLERLRLMDRKAILKDFVAEGGAARVILARFGTSPDFSLERADGLTIDHADKPEYFGAAVSFAVDHAADKLGDVPGAIERRWTSSDGRIARPSNALSVDPKEAANVLVRGLAAASLSKLAPQDYAETLIRLSFDASRQADLYRTMILGKPLPEEIDPRIVLPRGPRGVRFEDFIKRLPSLELIKALEGFIAAGVALNNPRPLAGTLITKVGPDPCCAGETVIIEGSGFRGSRRADVAVYFGSLRADVVRVGGAEQWSDRLIKVIVPVGASGALCVSVLEDTTINPLAVTNAQQAGAALDGVLGQFFPDLAASLPGGVYGSIGLTAGLPQAVCSVDGTNSVWIGPPQIDFFMANGVDSPSTSIRLRDGLVLSWRVRGASAVSLGFRPLDPTAAGFAPAVPGGAFAPEGQIGLPLRRVNQRWSAEYTLGAANKCGDAVPRNMRVNLDYGIGLVFAGAGTASIFNLGALGYIEGQPDLHPVVASGTGFGSIAAVAAARRPINTAALAQFHSEIAARASSSVGLFPPNPTIQQAVAGYRSGAYADLLNAVYAFANDVMQRYYAAPQVDTGDIKFDTDAAIREKQLGKILGKILPYTAKLLLKVADPKPTDTQLEAMDKAELIKLIKAEKVELEPVAAAIQQGVLDLSGSSDAELAAAKTGANMLIAVVSLIPGGQVAGIALGMVAAVLFGIIDGINDAAKRDRMIAAMAMRGLVIPGPLFTAIDSFMTRINASGSPGAALRVILAELESGLGAFITETGRIEDARGNVVAFPGAALPMNVLLRAAVAMPGLLPPLAIPTSIITTEDPTGSPAHFVEGSVIDPAPVEEAIDAGADAVFVIQGFPRVLPSAGNYSTPGFYSVMQRSRSMREQAVAKAALDAFEDWRDPRTGLADRVGAYAGAIHVIGATIPLPAIGPFEFEPALMAMWRDYGFMRAFDVFAALRLYPDPAQHAERIAYEMRLREMTDDLIRLRLSAWKLEYEIVADRLPGTRWPIGRGDRIVSVPNMLVGVTIRALKVQIRDKIEQRLTYVRSRHTSANWPGVAVPAVFQDWFKLFERPIDDVRGISIRNPGSGVAPPLGPWSELSRFSSSNAADFLASAPPPPDIAPSLLGPGP